MNELKKTNGTTLVELMVAFAIAGIFMVSATMLISSFTNVYLRIINRNRIQDISNVVMEKVFLEPASGNLPFLDSIICLGKSQIKPISPFNGSTN